MQTQSPSRHLKGYQRTPRPYDSTQDIVYSSKRVSTSNTAVYYGNDAEAGPISGASLFLGFLILFLPMFAVPWLLLGLVAWEKVNFPSSSNTVLPYDSLPPTGNYYTMVSAGKFSLVASWASTFVGNISALFLILFSFIIARSLIRGKDAVFNQSDRQDGFGNDKEERIREMLQSRSYMKLWQWFRGSIQIGSNRRKTDKAIFVAIAGLACTFLFTALVIVGDNWLHFAVSTDLMRYYDDLFYPVLNTSASADDPNSPQFLYAAGYSPLPDCQDFLDNRSPAGTYSCSLNNSQYFNLAQPFTAYQVLEAGLSSSASGLGNTDLDQALNSQSSSAGTGDLVITYPPVNSSNSSSYAEPTQSLLFWLDGALSYSDPDDDNTNVGYDYIAPTHSMKTQCTPINAPCQLDPGSPLYNCSSFFSGNLTEEPTTGLIRIPGWNTAFYKTSPTNGSVSELLVYEDANPFYFNVTAQIDAVSNMIDPSSSSLPPPLVPTVNGSVAFALSCTSTVYNVNYTLINSKITDLSPQLADPKFAAIVRAPLQVGYGRYNLYQSAILAVLGQSGTTESTGVEPLNSTMARAFSQVGVALSAGAFNYTTNIVQRARYDVSITVVPKAPVWFLAIACGLYALVSLGIFVAAMVLRTRPDVKAAQMRLKIAPKQGSIRKIFVGGLVEDVGASVDGYDSGSENGDKRREKERKEKKNKWNARNEGNSV